MEVLRILSFPIFAIPPSVVVIIPSVEAYSTSANEGEFFSKASEMINSITLLRNVGQFDSVSSGATIPLARLTLVYAENGRGKTTLAAILRSLATGNPIHIVERRRLAALHPPHVVLDCSGGPSAAVFQNNTWNRELADVVVFDDAFVDENVCSGLEVIAEHRQNLHELILGAQGVSLNQNL